MQLKIKLAAVAIAVGSTATLALASTPAMASQTVTETAHGAIYGKAAAANNAVFTLVWRGLVNTHGPFSSGGNAPKKGQTHTFPTAAGNLTVLVTASPAIAQSVDPKVCHFSYAVHVVFTAVGSKSTGSFAGASGPGTAELAGGGYVPRLTSGPHKGQCDESNSAPELAKGAFLSFQLSADLKV
jgi:hypothetical protein